MGKLSGECAEAVRRMWGGCLMGVGRLSGRCGDVVWRVLEGYLDGVGGYLEGVGTGMECMGRLTGRWGEGYLQGMWRLSRQ